MLIDTHCHVHEPDYPLSPDEVFAHADAAGVEALICVGTSEVSSRQALAFAAEYPHTYAAIGVHPHETQQGYQAIGTLLADGAHPVAIGEIGLDYFYTHSPRAVQIAALEAQLGWALQYDLPVIFHVREAFSDFWSIVDGAPRLRAVLHSFTDSRQQAEKALERGWYIGVNGISTFTKDLTQQELFRTLPLERVVLETDAPFLTPAPFRGTVNEPAKVRVVAEHQATSRGVSLDEVARVTTANARALFAI